MSEYTSQQIDNVPEGQVQDNSYVTGGNESIPVQSDGAPIEDPIQASSADTDQQLAQDDKEAIDKTNIIDERTRGSKPRRSYEEPGDDPIGMTE